MIMYLCSHNNSQAVNEAIEESGEILLKPIVEARISLCEFINIQLDQMQNAKTFVIDIIPLTDSEKEIIDCISNLRILYDSMKIIILATNREIGDSLLSELFCLGIYNLIKENEFELLKNDIKTCLTVGKSYKDSLKFKVNSAMSSQSEKVKKVKIKEKIVIKNEVVQSVNKVLIAFMGVQKRIGTTHQVVVSANYLKSKGFNVAVIECREVEHKTFSTIEESFELSKQGELFSLNQIDYYADFDLQDISRVLHKNYNFILLDLGLFSEKKLPEFSRAVIQIIVAGSKPWEIEFLNRVFSSAEESVLKEYCYLFNFTDVQNGTFLKEEMGSLNKVYLSGYTPDPFSTKAEYEDLKKIFKEFVLDDFVEKKKTSKKGWLPWKK